jgi:Acetoacetate decarboxylase (ADC)
MKRRRLDEMIGSFLTRGVSSLSRIISIITAMFLCAACANVVLADETLGSSEGQRVLPRYTHLGADGIYVVFAPQELKTYRQLLPTVFGMPDVALVKIYIADFYKMDPETQPYLEAAVFLLAKYDGEEVWHCVSMPVTSKAALRAGIIMGGWPKVLSDVTVQRIDPNYRGIVTIDGQRVLELTVETGQHTVSANEAQWFQKLAGIRYLNILNGNVIEPQGLKRRKKAANPVSLLRVSELHPSDTVLKVGTAQILFTPGTVTQSNPGLAAFGIRPENVVLAYYYKNDIPPSVSP